MNLFNINSDNNIGSKCVATVGMFDGVHRGHQLILNRLLSEAERHGLKPVVVTFNQHPRIVLGVVDGSFKLLSTTAERLQLLESAGVETVGMIDFTPQVAQLSSCDFFVHYLVERLNVAEIIVGYDNQFGNKRLNDFQQMLQLAQTMGIAVVEEHALQVGQIDVSSTQIRKALQSGNVALANSMLGRAYELSGTVVAGRQVGRTLGFPTANIEIGDKWKAIPADGVYAVQATIDGTSYPAMANIGQHPTFTGNERTFEVHIINYSGNLYGQTVVISMLDRLRNTIQFQSADELAMQLEADKQRTLSIVQ